MVNNRLEEFVLVVRSYEHITVAVTKSDKTIVGMILYGTEIDVIDGKEYNLLMVLLFL